MAKINYDELLSEFKKNKVEASTADNVETAVEDWMSFGNLSINYVASGKYLTGGLPTKRTTILHGPQSSGKTLLAMEVCIACQKKGGIAVFVDSEGTFSEHMFKKLGGNNRELIYKNGKTLEECWEFIELTIDIISKKHKDVPLVIIWDSIGDTPSQDDYDNNKVKSGDINISAQRNAKVNKFYAKRVSKKTNAMGVTLVILNTLVDTMKTNPFASGPTEDMPGGRHLKFHASVVNKCATRKYIYEDGEEYRTGDPIGINGSVSNTKNKVGLPYKRCVYKLFFNKGIDPLSGFFESLVFYKKLKKKTSTGKEWILQIPGKPEKELVLGKKDDASKNLRDVFLESPDIFFEDDDYNEGLMELLLADINRFKK